MTTKQKFEVENPEVVVLSNGRYAYRAMCPWKGKRDQALYAWKFCGQQAYERWVNNAVIWVMPETMPEHEEESDTDTETVYDHNTQPIRPHRQKATTGPESEQ
jgi:hypothetical protein